MWRRWRWQVQRWWRGGLDNVEEVVCVGVRECDEEKKKDEKEYDDTEERTAENAIGRGDEHERGNKGEGSRGQTAKDGRALWLSHGRRTDRGRSEKPSTHNLA